MKGLLIKDFRLMKVQKSFFLLIAVIGVWGTLLSENVTSAIGFLTFVMSLFSVSSISYDEFDNGNAFLFSLPITRTTYVVEKYCFGLILGLGAWTVFTLLALVSNGFRRILPTGELMISAAMILPMFLVILAVMLPIQLRFGGEKGRIALIAALGILILLGLAVVKIAKGMGIDLAGLLDALPIISMEVLLVGALVAAVLLLLLSVWISLGIIKRKEF